MMIEYVLVPAKTLRCREEGKNVATENGGVSLLQSRCYSM